MIEEDGEVRVNQFQEIDAAGLELNSKINNQLGEIKMAVNEAITEEGLLPEIGERGKDNGFNAEMLGYGLRIAVETEDRALFDQLKQGADLLKMDNGLFQARLNPDKTSDTSRGTTWADANQDIALSYIEAGEKWGDQALVDEGMQVANAFIEQQVVESGDYLVPLQNTVEEDNNILGGQIRRVNPSMYNPRLYEKMQQQFPEDPRWTRLAESGTRLIDATLDKFVLPPNVMNLVDGQIMSDSEVIGAVQSGSEITNTIPEAMKAKMANIDRTQIRPEWGFDSMRIPFRLNDGTSSEDRAVADKIYQRLLEHGGVKTKYYADTGEPHPDGMAAAVVTAPLSKSIESKTGTKQNVIDEIDKTISETDNQVLYWQLWRGLGLTQLRRN